MWTWFRDCNSLNQATVASYYSLDDGTAATRPIVVTLGEGEHSRIRITFASRSDGLQSRVRIFIWSCIHGIGIRRSLGTVLRRRRATDDCLADLHYIDRSDIVSTRSIGYDDTVVCGETSWA